MSKASFEAVISSVSSVLIQRGTVFGNNSLEHGLVGEFDIKLSQMGEVFFGIFYVVIVDGIPETFGHFCVKSAFGSDDVVVM